jgi:prophage DNA circulation protein
MIYSDSRYADGDVFKSYDSRYQNYNYTVFRVFPEDSSNFYYYTWTLSDRIDLIAHRLLGDPELWWRIMDFNPEISNPFYIEAGTRLRIPNE